MTSSQHSILQNFIRITPPLQVANQTRLGLQLVAGILHCLTHKQPTPIPLLPSNPKLQPKNPSQQMNIAIQVPTPTHDTGTLPRVPTPHTTHPSALPRVHRPIKIHPHTILRTGKNLSPSIEPIKDK